MIVGNSFLTDLEAATAGIPSRKNVRQKTKSRLLVTLPGSLIPGQSASDPIGPGHPGRNNKRGYNIAQITSRRNKYSRLATEAEDSEGIIGGIDLPDTDNNGSEPISVGSGHVGQWLEEISAQTFDGDKIEEAVNYIRRTGMWGTRNLIFSFTEPFYGLNGNARLGKKERTLMREVAEALCGAVFAPQINPAWSKGTHMRMEEHMKDPAFDS